MSIWKLPHPNGAFLGSPELKTKIQARIAGHRAVDALIHGVGWEDGKGCAVGCTLESYDHAAYETELGIPQILARLEDRIFEGTSNGWSQEWPTRFIDAIPVGSDLSGVWPKFAVWVLTDPEAGVVKFAKTDRTKSAISAVAAAYERDEQSRETWQQLRDEARASASAAYASASAADASASAADASASAAYASASYADASAYAASAAYDASASAASAAYAASSAAARRKHYELMGEKLLELMAAAPRVKVAA